MKKVRLSLPERIALCGVFAALYVVFSAFLGMKIGNWLEISWASLPILLCAFLLTPGEALAVAAVGSFAEQMIGFGLAATTALWMLPVVVQALASSLLFRKYGRKKGGMLAAILISEILLTVLNVGVSFLDAYLMHYLEYLTISIPIRGVNCAVRAVLSCLAVPLLYKPLEKLFLRGAK